MYIRWMGVDWLKKTLPFFSLSPKELGIGLIDACLIFHATSEKRLEITV